MDPWAFQVALVLDFRLPIKETLRDLGSILGRKKLLEESMATHSSIHLENLLVPLHRDRKAWWATVKGTQKESDTTK